MSFPFKFSGRVYTLPVRMSPVRIGGKLVAIRVRYPNQPLKDFPLSKGGIDGALAAAKRHVSVIERTHGKIIISKIKPDARGWYSRKSERKTVASFGYTTKSFSWALHGGQRKAERAATEWRKQQLATAQLI